MNITAWV